MMTVSRENAPEPATPKSPAAMIAWPNTIVASTPQRSAIQPAGRDMSAAPM